MTTELLIKQFGKLHPLVLHFPVVFITLIPLLLLLSLCNKGKFWTQTLPYFIHASSVTSILAVILGLAAFKGFSEPEAPLLVHRNLTIIATILISTLSFLIIIRREKFETRAPLYIWIFTFVTAAILIYGAHEGAETTHGTLFILSNLK